MLYNSDMLIFGVVAYVLLGLAIIFLSSLHIRVDNHVFELSRRADSGDKSAKRALHRRQMFYSLIDVKNIFILVLAAGFTSVGVARFGWSAGIIFSIVILALTQVIARARWIGRFSDMFYKNHETWLLTAAEQVDKYAAFVGVARHRTLDTFQIESSDETLYLIKHARGVESEDKRAIEARMSMDETKVKSLMIDAKNIDHIKYSELLGPLVLHDLHQTGHRWFPVIKDNLDSTLGFLDSRDALTIDSKKSVKARTAMQHEAVKINQNDNLHAALDTFMKTGSWIILVIDDDKKVVGLIGLPDVMNHIRGKEA